LKLKQVTIRELVAATTASPRFRIKHQPMIADLPQHHTPISRETSLFCLADETDTFILHNRFVGGDTWSDDLGDYSTPVWETVVLHSGSEVFENIAAGVDNHCRLDWPGGSIMFNTVSVERLMRGTEPASLAVSGALVYTTVFEGAPCEFLVELELVGPLGEWRLSRSAIGPGGFTLTTAKPSA
jgi:hypothetical protein